MDDAFDNVFHIMVDEAPSEQDRVWLEYELYGARDHDAIARSINQQRCVGGRVLRSASGWTEQRERIAPYQIMQGRNTVQFSSYAPQLPYRIRKIKITVEKRAAVDERAVVITSASDSVFNGHRYAKGFLQGSDAERATLFFNGDTVQVEDGQFELLWEVGKTSNKRTKGFLEAQFPDGGRAIKWLAKGEQGLADGVLPEPPFLPATTGVFYPGEPLRMVCQGAVLALNGGDFEQRLPITLRPLHEVDLAPLNADMVNVTKKVAGYRFLPDGTRFTKQVSLTIPYDPALLPQGYTAEDIRTFYFDLTTRRWLPVPRDSILAGSEAVRSSTDHFTDYINGIVQVPESPETMGYQPTTIKDLKLGDVSSGITPLVPPVASNTGAMMTHFPLKLPQGRQGMQPDLAIQYNSEASNGWLGIGWSLGVSSITLDTRWGVPRYDSIFETETYLLDGEQLNGVGHRGWTVARMDPRTFHPRVEGAFRKIVRYGDGPSSYRWEVTDKQGTVSYYGGISNVVSTAVLRDPLNGHIAKWALVRVKDTNGNTIDYEHEVETHTGVPGNGGRQLYVKKINYTGSVGTPGRYSVEFIRDGGARPDVMINGRLGFLEVTSHRLSRIVIKYDDQLIRKYSLTYQVGAFKKSLLHSISEIDRDDEVFYSHTFEYFNDVRDSTGVYQPYPQEATDWDVPDDDISGPLLNFTTGLFNEPTVLGGSEVGNYGFGGSITVGPLGSNYSKQNTIGGNYHYSASTADGMVSLIDVDGDNLPDKLFRYAPIGGSFDLYYRPNLVDVSGNTTFGDIVPLTLRSFNRSRTRSSTKGFEVHPGIAYAGLTWTNSETTTKDYMLDRNGDGLMDIALGGLVNFNSQQDGATVFDPLSTTTENPIQGGTIAPGIEMVDPAYLDTLEEENPLHDVVRVWTAPYQGDVRVTGTIQLLSDVDAASYYHEDGVIASVQLRQDDRVELPIDSGDFGIYNFPGAGPFESISVNKGDRIYFRLGSSYDGAFDEVRWDPVVEYLSTQNPSFTSSIDPNGNNPLRFDATDDFLLAGSQTVIIPDNGTLTIAGTFNCPALSDEIEILITALDTNGTDDLDTLINVLVPANMTYTAPVGGSYAVLPGMEIDLQVRASTNVEWEAIDWSPALTFVEGTDTTRFRPIVTYSMYDHVNKWTLPNFPFTTTSDPTQLIVVQDTIQITLSPLPILTTFSSLDTVAITLTVKGNRELLGKQRMLYQGGYVNPPLDPDISLILYPDDSIYVEYHIDNRLVADSQQMTVDVNAQLVPGTGLYIGPDLEDVIPAALGIHTVLSPEEQIYGPQYRCWGQFVYRGNGVQHLAIEEQLLVLDLNQLGGDAGDVDQPLDPNGLTAYDPAQATFLYMPASRERNAYVGFDEFTYVQRDTVSSSRLGEDDLSYATGGSLNPALSFVPQKRTQSSGDGSSISASYIIGLGGGDSDAMDRSIVDVMDLNGDRYPDNLSEDSIQFTEPTGKLSTRLVQHGFEDTHLSQTSASGFTSSGSPVIPKSGNSGGSPATKIAAALKTMMGLNKSAGSANEASKVSLSVSYDGTASHDTVKVTWMDINGDGLPDRVYEDGRASLNVGYRFIAPEQWEFEDGIRDGTSSDHSLGTGISLYNGSIAIGFGGSWTNNHAVHGFQDVNGDGLVDKLMTAGDPGQVPSMSDEDEITSVRFNLGNGFSEPIPWVLPGTIDEGYSAGESFNAGFTFCIPIPIIGIRFCFNPSVSLGHGLSRPETQFLDMNGDGYADYLKSNGQNDLQVWSSTIGRTNLLKEVNGPLHATYDVDYELVGNTYDLPQGKWVMKSLSVFDGQPGDGASTSLRTFHYTGGKYSRRERESYGFAQVRTEERDTDNDDALYRTTISTYDVSGYYTKGLLLRSRLEDSAGHPYTQTVNTYELRDLNGDVVPPLFNTSNDSGVAFPALTATKQLYYEGLPDSGIVRSMYFDYDSIGNVVLYTDAGNEGSDEVVQAEIEYHDLGQTSYIKAIPSSIKVRIDDVVKRESEQDIDDDGNITHIRQAVGDGTNAGFDLTYYPNGNLKRITRPANANGERLFYEYQYDADVSTRVTQVSDAYLLVSHSSYEPLFGQVVETQDINNQHTVYSIDTRGRVDTVIGPYELNVHPYTIAIEYLTNTVRPYSLVRHFDPESGGVIKTYTYLDGLFRPLQVRKTSVITDIADNEVIGFSGSELIKYDAFGREVARFFPGWVPQSFPLDSLIVTSEQFFTGTTYDVLDRPISLTLPLDAITSYTYSITSDVGAAAFETTVTDPLGHHKITYTDVRGRQRARVDFSVNGPIVTRSNYNGLGELRSVVDQGGDTTAYTYDLLGRKLTYKHPDAGLTKFTYDLAGNLVRKATANLFAMFQDSGAINYTYEYERLRRIDYPRNFQNQVLYDYGAMGAPHNRAGRVWRQLDASGGQEYFYGPLGEVEKTIRTVIINQAQIHTYVSEQRFDTWNRIQEMSYPDGEVVSYGYNEAGLLHSMSSNKEGQTYSLIDAIGYDKFEQRVYMKQGNGTTTRYSYEAARRRLSELTVKLPNTASERVIMDAQYTYDAVNNIIQLVNQAAPVPDELGGTMTSTYEYDSLYRLVGANGTYAGPIRNDSYALTMVYDDVHNITAKQQSHTSNILTSVLTNHALPYVYGGERPHIPTRVGNRTYNYDANGNLVGWQEDAPSLRSRDIYWDEENRITGIADDGYMSLYTYDAAGERVLKSHGGMQAVYINGSPIGLVNHTKNYSVYVSPYFVVNELGFTKHYFIEGQRVTSKLGTGRFIFGPGSLPGLTAGGWNYHERIVQLQQAQEQHLYEQQTNTPWHPSQPSGNAQPDNNGVPYGPIQLGDFSYPEGSEWTQTLPQPTPGHPGSPPPQPTPAVSAANAHAGYAFQPATNQAEVNQYFYHPDHLGSTSYITDVLGHIRQHIEYTAFGETYVEEHSSTDTQPYLFNSKELDGVTGLYYYGARYYDPVVSIWVSADPLAEKYPGWSPFNYALQNPIVFVDPDGRFSMSIHSEIVEAAFQQSSMGSGLNGYFMDDVRFGASLVSDVGGYFGKNLHFDNRQNYSQVATTWESLDASLKSTSSCLGQVNTAIGGSDAVELGTLIHTVQDFYSHSNYVDLYSEYFKSLTGVMPTTVPIYDDGIRNPAFNALLKDNLRTGDFHPVDNEFTNPNGSRASMPTSHARMNKDNADSLLGRLAKQTATDHTTKILEAVKE